MKKLIIILSVLLLLVTFSCKKDPEIIMVSSIAFSEDAPNVMETGDSALLKVLVLPENATEKSVAWASSDAEVISVDQAGNIKALKAGKATISATAKDASGIKAELAITVNDPVVKVSSVTFAEGSPKAMEVGDKYNLEVSVLPADATDKTILWSTSDAETIKVDESGNIEALKVGKATITAAANDGSSLSDSVEISVYEKITAISFDKTVLSMEKDKEEKITATPSSYPYKWTSSNTNVATVDQNGVVKAVGLGKAEITASNLDGSVKATCKVSVNGIAFKEDSYTIKQYKSLKLTLDNLITEGIEPPSSGLRIISCIGGEYAAVLGAGPKYFQVYGQKIGENEITVNFNTGHSIKLRIKVIPCPPESLSMTIESSKLGLGYQDEVYKWVIMNPHNISACYQKSWSSSNPEIISVDEKGVITSHASSGSAIITLTVAGLSASVTVEAVPAITSFTFTVPEIVYTNSSGINFSYEIEPKESEANNIVFEVDKPGYIHYVNVDRKNLVLVAEGLPTSVVTITAKSQTSAEPLDTKTIKFIKASFADLGGKYSINVTDDEKSDVLRYEIPSQYEGKPVTAIRKLGKRKPGGEYIVPESITTICETAMKDLGETTVTYADGVKLTSIGTEAFIASQIKELPPIADGATIYARAFGETKLKKVHLGNNITLADQAFNECTELSEFRVGNGCTLGDDRALSYVLRGCTNIDSIFIGDDCILNHLVELLHNKKPCKVWVGGNTTEKNGTSLFNGVLYNTVMKQVDIFFAGENCPIEVPINPNVILHPNSSIAKWEKFVPGSTGGI